MSKHTYTVRGIVTLRSATYQTTEGNDSNQSRTFAEYINTPNGPVLIPYISQPSVRAVIRRMAAEHIWNHLRDRLDDGGSREEFQIVRETFQSVSRGSFGRNAMKPAAATLEDIVAANNHVFAALFGGGMLMHHSKLHMDNALRPMVEETRDLFPSEYAGDCFGSAVREVKLAEGETEKRFRSALLQDVLLAPRDDFESGGGIGVIENHEESLAMYQAEVASTSAAKKVQKAAEAEAAKNGARLNIAAEDRVKMATTRLMLKLQTIVPGTRLYFGLTLEKVTEAQLGLSLLAIRDWANRNSLGGGSARGFGHFGIALSLGGEGGTIVRETLLSGDAPFYKLSENDTVTAAVEAANREIAEINRANLAKVFPIDMNAAKTKPQKAA